MMKCRACPQPAEWEYHPSEGVYCCDACVPRGCSCRLELKAGIVEIIDENGLLANPEEDYEMENLPCIEWWKIDDRENV